MNAAESVRFVAKQFLQNYKHQLDESTFETAELLIENTPPEKVVRNVMKILKPFVDKSEKGKLDKKSLIEQGWITEKSSLNDEEIKSMGQQAEMAYSLCNAISEMEPNKLKQIEEMAATIQMGIEAKMNGMTEEEKKKIDPTSMIASAIGGGENDGEIASVVNSLMGALIPKETAMVGNKKSLMQSFSEIDGNVAKRK